MLAARKRAFALEIEEERTHRFRVLDLACCDAPERLIERHALQCDRFLVACERALDEIGGEEDGQVLGGIAGGGVDAAQPLQTPRPVAGLFLEFSFRGSLVRLTRLQRAGG